MISISRYSVKTLLVLTTIAALIAVLLAYYFQLGAFAKQPFVQTLEAYLGQYPHAEIIEQRGVEKKGTYEVLGEFHNADSNGPGLARISYTVDGRSRDVQVNLTKEYAAIFCAELRDPVTQKRGYVVLGVAD